MKNKIHYNRAHHGKTVCGNKINNKLFVSRNRKKVTCKICLKN